MLPSYDLAYCALPMNTFLKRTFGIIFAEEAQGYITLNSVNANALRADLMSAWSTSRIENYMFTEIKSNRLKFASFFAPDVHFILQTLIDRQRKVRVNKRHLTDAIKALEENTWLSSINAPTVSKFNRARLQKFYKTPLDHQNDFFTAYDRYTQAYGLNGYLLSARAGSGKTLTDLMVAEMLDAKTVIIVSPNNAVESVWAKTLQTEYRVPEPFWLAGRGKAYNGQRFLISHYEGLPELLREVKAAKLTEDVVVVLDECHNLNDIKAQRTQLFIELCQYTQSKDIIWASGTPVKAMGYEVIPLLRTIDPLFTADVEERFKKIFGRESKRALDILRNRMGMITYKVEGLPVKNEVTDIDVQVVIPDGQKYTLDAISQEMREFIEDRMEYYEKNFKKFEADYNRMLEIHSKGLKGTDLEDFQKYQTYIRTIRKGYSAELHKAEAAYCNYYELKRIIPSLPQSMREEFRSVRSVIKYVELKVMGEALGGVLGRKRAEVHRAMIQHANLEQYVNDAVAKTLIFTSYVSVVKDMDAYFRKLQFNPVLVYGETNKELTSMLKAFENRAELNPAIATYMSLSTAVPMTMASTAIMFNQPFRDHERTQARARLDRLGQKNPVTFVNVYLDTGTAPNISTRSLDILNWSKEQVIKIMGADTQLLGSTLDTLVASTESERCEELWGPERDLLDADAAMESLLEDLT